MVARGTSSANSWLAAQLRKTACDASDTSPSADTSPRPCPLIAGTQSC